MKISTIRMKGGDGEVCIKPPFGSFDPALTMCGYVEANLPWSPTNDPVTCQSCQQNYDVLRNGIKLVRA